MLAAGLQALGANADPLPLPEVNQALQNGTIDGVEANLPLIYTSQWYEQAKYVTGNVNLWPFPTVLVINKAVYDGLTDDAEDGPDRRGREASPPTRSRSSPTPGSTVAQDLANCGVEVPDRDRRRQGGAEPRPVRPRSRASPPRPRTS